MSRLCAKDFIEYLVFPMYIFLCFFLFGGLKSASLYGTIEASRKKAVMRKMRIQKNWITSAHRGFVTGALKENSLAAYYNAHLHGADMIETDARSTRDGVLIVNHDPIAWLRKPLPM